MTSTRTDPIVIAGAGHVGLIAAIAIGQTFENVISLGVVPEGNDKRTTALMVPAIKFLERIGLWESIEPHAAPITTMRIIDGTNRLIRSPTVSFEASEIDEPAFGYNIPNVTLTSVLSDALKGSAVKHVAASASHYHPTENAIAVEASDGSMYTANIVIAADGRSSLAREAAGMSARTWSYNQTATVLSFSHTRDHHDISTEFHTEYGPFTQVPLSGKHSSLVWVTTPAHAVELLELTRDQLAMRVEERMQSMLGAVTIDVDPQSWPLSGLVPTSFARNRVFLAGESAHVFPPIGAQGLNLGVRDVETLLETLPNDATDLGVSNVMSTYNRKRSPDIIARTGAVDALNRSLLSDFLPVQMVRSGGLELLRTFSPLRGFVMREGLRPGSGFRFSRKDAAQNQ
ncbi:UbiH/UbiF family hydroxylase [Phyllobacterium zundukense]|uniref:2-octaprenyl-6-methoxyphenyl hydroxylase n=1 Tax=Phyllobacterium zundukense TaxID=1867719 RepID=A0A2N9W4Y6_9HYPH|nr:UbiH/UbiF family hydroxylase [Phyllobacterium zundukense]ATU91732.1 2-octaprenyl-6-methoxyphenyl hydroxylase [Phyllobacterium zundukense]PIO46804.1 2-octaprenyl-6-methoxyphenyl hydroxylase [Phyllobacterium zundukense]